MATPDQYRAFNIKDTDTRREFERSGPPEKKVVIPEVKSKKPEQRYSTNTTTNPNVPPTEKPYELEISHYVSLFDRIANDGLAKRQYYYIGPTLSGYINWVTATNYTKSNIRLHGGFPYVCLISHLSNDFNTDLSNGKWELRTNCLMVNRGIDKGSVAWDLTTLWGSLNNYVVGNVVKDNDVDYYKCIVNHTSTVSFAADIVSGYWENVHNYTNPIYYPETAYDGWIAFKAPKLTDGHDEDDSLALPILGSGIENSNNNSKRLRYIRREEGWRGNAPVTSPYIGPLTQYNFIYFKAPKTGVYEVKVQLDFEYTFPGLPVPYPPTNHLLKGVLVMNKIPVGTTFPNTDIPAVDLPVSDDNCPAYFNPLVYGSDTATHIDVQEHTYCYCILDMKTQTDIEYSRRMTKVRETYTSNPPPEPKLPDVYSINTPQYYTGDIVFYQGKYYKANDSFVPSGWTLDNIAAHWTETTLVIEQPDNGLVYIEYPALYEDNYINKLFHLGGKTLVYLKQGDVINWFYKLNYLAYDYCLNLMANGSEIETITHAVDILAHLSEQNFYDKQIDFIDVNFLDQKIDIKWIGNDARQATPHKVLPYKRLKRFFVPPNLYQVDL